MVNGEERKREHGLDALLIDVVRALAKLADGRISAVDLQLLLFS